MKSTFVVSFFLLTFSGLAAAQATTVHGLFLNKDCGFQVKIPSGWRIKPVPSKKCTFKVIVPQHPDGDLEILVRDGDIAQGSDDLGFSKEDEKWIVQGEGSSQATEIHSSSWTGLQGSVDTRIYSKAGYSGLGSQTRALLFDRKNRIAEVTAYDGEEFVPQFVKSFQFVTQP
jgi:hypothetical protein